MSKIIFTDTIGIPEDFFPKTSLSSIPKWYKELESYVGGQKKPSEDSTTKATIKKCMPVFDAISSGYIIYTYTDIYVSQKKVQYADGEKNNETGEVEFLSEEEIEKLNLPKNEAYYQWPSFKPLGFHPIEQAPNHPNRNGTPYSYPKWINPWSIKTPKGYSVLFTQPMHRDSVFTILPGIVDTDKYNAPVNFPFVLNDPEFEGLIPAGTPMAQVIPFKRESWNMSIGSDKDFKDQQKTTTFLRTSFFDSYKNKFRQTKEYR